MPPSVGECQASKQPCAYLREHLSTKRACQYTCQCSSHCCDSAGSALCCGGGPVLSIPLRISCELKDHEELPEQACAVGR